MRLVGFTGHCVVMDDGLSPKWDLGKSLLTFSTSETPVKNILGLLNTLNISITLSINVSVQAKASYKVPETLHIPSNSWVLSGKHSKTLDLII